MLSKLIRQIAFILLAFSSVHGTANADLSDKLLADAKAATAFAVRDDSSGTAVCVDPRGLFITCNHVVEDRFQDGDEIQLVLHSGEPNQRTLRAFLIGRAQPHDLAVLWAPDAQDLTALPIAPVEGLEAGASVTSFGFPFGRARAEKGGDYPRVRVKTGKIKHLHRRIKRIDVIQLDAFLDPGESGGPILNDKGQVVGIIQSGVRKLSNGRSVSTGVSFGVAPIRVTELLHKPGYLPIAPRQIPFDERSTAIEVTIKRIPTFAEVDSGDLKATLIVKASETDRREYTLKRIGDDTFKATAPPMPESTGKLALAARLSYEGGTRGAVYNIRDDVFSVNGRELKFSEALRIEPGRTPKVFTRDGRLLFGKLGKLDPKITSPGTGWTKMEEAEVIEMEATRQIRGHTELEFEVSGPAGQTATLRRQIKLTNAPRFLYESHAIPALPEERIVPLPGIAGRVAYGGAGRFLIAQLTDIDLLAVCDLANASVVGVIPADATHARFAADRSHLVIVDNQARVIQRWDLETLTKNGEAELAFESPVEIALMGHAGDGPLLAITKHRTYAFDVSSLKVIALSGLEHLGTGGAQDADAWVSSSGRVMSIANFTAGPARHAIVHLDLPESKAHIEPYTGASIDRDTGGFIRLGQSGEFVWYGSGVAQLPMPPLNADNHRNRQRLVPVDGAPLCLRFRQDHVSPLDICSMQDGDVILRLPSLPELSFTRYQPDGFRHTMDMRFRIDWNHQRMVTVAADNRRIVIRELDLLAELKRRKSDYLFISSTPTVTVEPGGQYRYKPHVHAGRRIVSYTLSDPLGRDDDRSAYSPPPGMTIDSEGQIAWPAPEKLPAEGVPVELYVRDEAGHVVSQKFRITAAPRRVLRARVRVPATYNRGNPIVSGVHVRPGDTIRFDKPHGRWSGGKKPRWATGRPGANTYRGDRTGWMKLMVRVNGKDFSPDRTKPVTVTEATVLRFFCRDPRPHDNTGEMRIGLTIEPGSDP